MPTLPVALTIAGFDTCAGAGLQADLLTFHNLGVHGLTVATAIVVETPLQVDRVEPVSEQLLRQQLELLLATYPISAIKVGLLTSPSQVTALAELLSQQKIPLVIDPVGISSTGSSLQQSGTSTALIEQLAPLAALLTPNLPEALTLLNQPKDSDPAQAAQQLTAKAQSNILLTGGHNDDSNADLTDLLIENGIETRFSAPRIDTPASLHGTGCVLSSAITAGLAQGKTLTESIKSARLYLRKTLQNHLTFPHSQALLALNHHPQPPQP